MRTAFLLRTAWRDSHQNLGKLILFMSSIVLGIAALVAINAFNYNVSNDIDEQAASLLGADIAVSGNREASEVVLTALDSLPGARAREVDLLSMAYFPQIDESQFVRINALEGDFPFYGKLQTEPHGARTLLQETRQALVEESLMLQYDLNVGDSMRLGRATFHIGGRLKNAFGRAGISGSFAPTVYIPLADLEATGLIQRGSLVTYKYYQKVPPGFDTEAWQDARKQAFRTENMRIETVTDRKEDLSEAFEGLNTFLNLVALVALVLGCIGVASSVFIYVRDKVSSIAIFRCLGMTGAQAFFIYFAQISVLGVAGVLAGALIGSFVQTLLPVVLSDFLPLEVSTTVSWRAIAEGSVVGILVTVLFASLPLSTIRNVSPLRTLRTSSDEPGLSKDPLMWALIAAIAVSAFLFLWYLTGDVFDGLGFTGGLFAGFAVLFVVARAIIWTVRRFYPRRLNFVLRQGIANMYRPNNQTTTLLVSIGLGTAVLTTLFVTQGLILKNVARMDAGNQPNTILFGIENDQRDSLAEMTREFDLPLIQQVPIVTMRLEGWQGRSRAEWLADTNRTAETWAIQREARVTYRDTLDDNEELITGTFTGRRKAPGDTIFISLAQAYADALDVDIGDQLVFNVQGARLETYVGSIRKIDYANMNTRFFIVFPTGVLEDAPQFHVIVTKTPDAATTADYRAAVVRTFPNVSVVDLTTILEALSDVLRKVSYIIKFMAVFCILTGLIVLISSLLLSRYQRIRESVLLRTLGASRRQVMQINTTEYLAIGALSAATGIVIALAGSYLLARFQLELDFAISWLPIALVFVIVTGLTTAIGMLNTREVVQKPPLEVLRKEAE